MKRMAEDPPLSFKCADKVMIQSIIISPDRSLKTLDDIFSLSSSSTEESEIHQQKLHVAYLPPARPTVMQPPMWSELINGMAMNDRTSEVSALTDKPSESDYASGHHGISASKSGRFSKIRIHELWKKRRF